VVHILFPSIHHVISLNQQRVDITRNGKIHARQVNLINPHEVILIKYPFHFEKYILPNYFEKREVFHLIDFISNPMFFTLISPVVLFLLLPRLVPQGPEMQEAFEVEGGKVCTEDRTVE
jgi:hypothetical protein